MAKKKRSLADELQVYGSRSVDGLGRMAKSLRDTVRSVETPLDPYAEDIASWLPGYAAMEGVRLGSEAGRLWDNGRHGRAVVTMGDAIEAPMDELWWFLPGAGIVRKLK